ncbi:unnamed protein product [Rotaria magnacalcarata]|uniref:Uncharacterized protein n=1 Tax=Rotaria magnacalcarata TaxID=392030 RepID=A0A814FI25_9BILA|nr:unnamed protein product [Rotaria magnacalcarata]CAF1225881.1 unnamed protein product [Rotaria magnacalcarata]CAF1915889.1 unnamed protein product [Rotaria magnacalcarata]CAF1934770.1 unnamed protein product [Rotaria magnacalcarata]CAF2034114.1 unnamed protein product [Rotaria magnacalcarata]
MSHFIKHRLLLAEQMDDLHEKCELLRKYMIENHFEQSLLSSICDWGQRAIIKIQEIAENTLNDLHEKMEKVKSQAEISINKIISEFELNSKTDDYKEIEHVRWSKEILELRGKDIPRWDFFDFFHVFMYLFVSGIRFHYKIEFISICNKNL